MYDMKSLKAEEFINDEEIKATLEYAEQNKHNRELIEQILEKARPSRYLKRQDPGKPAEALNVQDFLTVRQVCSLPVIFPK